jgi:hypothetical protein
MPGSDVRHPSFPSSNRNRGYHQLRSIHLDRPRSNAFPSLTAGLLSHRIKPRKGACAANGVRTRFRWHTACCRSRRRRSSTDRSHSLLAFVSFRIGSAAAAASPDAVVEEPTATVRRARSGGCGGRSRECARSRFGLEDLDAGLFALVGGTDGSWILASLACARPIKGTRRLGRCRGAGR